MSEKIKPIITAKGLRKNYGSFQAVNELNLSIKKGEMFGLLGPNGAGKTTIILMILGLTEPTLGSCRVFGYDPIKSPIEVKRLCGYLPERLGFYENLTASSNLRYIAGLNGITGSKAESLINEALSDVGLFKHKDTKVEKFSRGMKQRLGIANAFFKKPELVILDEPTQGIDPRGIEEIISYFKRLNREEEITLLLSSHNIQLVQETCTSVGIISKGKLMKKGSIQLLESERKNFLIDVEVDNLNENVLNLLKDIKSINKIDREENRLVISCTRDVRSSIAETLIKNGASLTRINLREQSLLDAYRKYSEEV